MGCTPPERKIDNIPASNATPVLRGVTSIE
jgi:hypothetical protein